MGEVLAKAIFLGTECGSRPLYFISRIWGTCASNGIHDWGMECTGSIQELRSCRTTIAPEIEDTGTLTDSGISVQGVGTYGVEVQGLGAQNDQCLGLGNRNTCCNGSAGVEGVGTCWVTVESGSGGANWSSSWERVETAWFSCLCGRGAQQHGTLEALGSEFRVNEDCIGPPCWESPVSTGVMRIARAVLFLSLWEKVTPWGWGDTVKMLSVLFYAGFSVSAFCSSPAVSHHIFINMQLLIHWFWCFCGGAEH